METDWHPFWISYEWWSDIGTGALGVAAAVLTAAATLVVAIRSHRLAKKVAEDAEKRAEKDRQDAEKRAEQDRDDRYRDRLGHTIESAMTAIIGYGNELAPRYFATPEERQLHATAQARLVLVDATANNHDAPATRAVLEEFLRVLDQKRWDVRKEAAGLLTGLLPQVLARKNSPEQIAAAARGIIDMATTTAAERSRQTRERRPAD